MIRIKKPIVPYYGEYSDDEVDMLFREGWESCMSNQVYEETFPLPWREGWRKANKHKQQDRPNVQTNSSVQRRAASRRQRMARIRQSLQ